MTEGSDRCEKEEGSVLGGVIVEGERLMQGQVRPAGAFGCRPART